MAHDSKEIPQPSFQIIDYTVPYKEAVNDGTPLPPEIASILERFNKYDLAKDIEERGIDKLREEASKVEELTQNPEFTRAIEEGIAIAQSTNPLVDLKTINIYLISAGKRTDARSFNRGIIFNLSNLVNKNFDPSQMIEVIKSMTAHECIHQFVAQLGLKGEFETGEERLLHGIWEEGFATSVEIVHHPWHQDFVEDAEFWIESIRNWIKAKGDPQKRRGIMRKCFQRPVYKKWLDKEGKKLAKFEEDTDVAGSAFSKFIFDSNGPAYHVGYVLWERELAKGRTKQEIMMEGSGRMREWMGLEGNLEEVK